MLEPSESKREVEVMEGSKGRKKTGRAVVLQLPPHLSSPIPQVDGEEGKKAKPPPSVPPWRRRKRSGRVVEEEEVHRRPWYERIDEYFDELEAEKAKKENT